MKRINNIKIYEDLDNNALIKHICKKYHILYEDILDWHIIKKSIDARNKDNIHYLYNIAISFKSEKKYSKFDDYKITSRWIILYGNFEYTEIYKGKNNSSSSTKIVKIARAFDTDKEIIDFIKKNSTK